jgi:hypothetical protein
MSVIENAPLLASISKTEVVPPQMAKNILGVFPSLVAVAEAAGVTRGFFTGRCNEDHIGLSRSNPIFPSL